MKLNKMTNTNEKGLMKKVLKVSVNLMKEIAESAGKFAYLNFGAIYNIGKDAIGTLSNYSLGKEKPVNNFNNFEKNFYQNWLNLKRE